MRWAVLFVVALGLAAEWNDASVLSIALVIVLALVAVRAIYIADTR